MTTAKIYMANLPFAILDLSFPGNSVEFLNGYAALAQFGCTMFLQMSFIQVRGCGVCDDGWHTATCIRNAVLLTQLDLAHCYHLGSVSCNMSLVSISLLLDYPS